MMKNVHAGIALTVVAVSFGIVAGACGWMYFALVPRYSGNGFVFLLFVVACLGAIVSLTCAALAYSNWPPQWEREEKRTGRVPGERKK